MPAGPDGADDDEHYEKAISESNCIYRLQGDRLRPHEQGWASVPHLSLLDSSQVSICTINERSYSNYIAMSSNVKQLVTEYNYSYLHSIMMCKVHDRFISAEQICEYTNAYVLYNKLFSFRLCCLTSAVSSICGTVKTWGRARGKWRCSWHSRSGMEFMITATAGSILWIPRADTT